MMGTKARIFVPIAVVSLEDLVPSNHFYRHLDRVLDLSFVRDLVKETYAHGGRPSIDPVVFFKLQLVMFFEGLRSERQLMRHAADRLSILWYLGYDLGEPLPDHSSLTRIRERYGVEVFRRFFEQIVEQCQQEGLVWGRELYIDATKVEANASLASVKPRFFVEAHLATLFGEAAEQPTEEAEHRASRDEGAGSQQAVQEETPVPIQLPTSLPGIPPSAHAAIAPMSRTAITVHSRPNVPAASRDAVSAAVWMRRCWIECAPITRRTPTKKPIASAMCGLNPYLPKANSGMACGAFAYENCGA